MRKFILVIPIIGLLSSCSLFRVVEQKENSVPSALTLKKVLQGFQKSKQICGFDLNPSDTMSKEKVCSYPVKQSFCRLDAYYKHVVEFFLSDTTMFEENYMPIKQPFYPTFAFKPNMKSTISCILSFGTEEIAISNNDSTYVTFRLKNTDAFKRLCDEIVVLNTSKTK